MIWFDCFLPFIHYEIDTLGYRIRFIIFTWLWRIFLFMTGLRTRSSAVLSLSSSFIYSLTPPSPTKVIIFFLLLILLISLVLNLLFYTLVYRLMWTWFILISRVYIPWIQKGAVLYKCLGSQWINKMFAEYMKLLSLVILQFFYQPFSYLFIQ